MITARRHAPSRSVLAVAIAVALLACCALRAGVAAPPGSADEAELTIGYGTLKVRVLQTLFEQQHV